MRDGQKVHDPIPPVSCVSLKFDSQTRARIGFVFPNHAVLSHFHRNSLLICFANRRVGSNPTNDRSCSRLSDAAADLLTSKEIDTLLATLK